MPSLSKHPPELLRQNRHELRTRAQDGDLRLPEAIREVRAAYGLTRNGFASITGVPVEELRGIENESTSPSLETLFKIGKAFGLVPGLVPKKGTGRMPQQWLDFMESGFERESEN